MKSNDIQKQLYPIQNIIEAHNKTKEYFHKFWDNPKKKEEEIFCQFIMMQSFINFQYPPEVVYDYWEYLNSIMVAEIGEQRFYKFFKKKDKRFKEYLNLYKKLSNSPFFEFGGEPQTGEEFSAISEFCGTVFQRVEKNYIYDEYKNIELAQKCKSACVFLITSMHQTI
ncbi:MAG: hypothetical protein U9P73_03300 [Candidatus Cloacimonadota bacterium]|nr:hypothetical protein [Candidatus Cloacimonadota bacterium]